MDRRRFFRTTLTGLVGLAVSARLGWAVPTPVRTYAALDYMRADFNRRCKGKGAKAMPRTYHVAPPLFEAMRGELQTLTRELYGSPDMRIHGHLFTNPEPFLYFKCAKVYEAPWLRGWDFAVDVSE